VLIWLYQVRAFLAKKEKTASGFIPGAVFYFQFKADMYRNGIRWKGYLD